MNTLFYTQPPATVRRQVARSAREGSMRTGGFQSDEDGSSEDNDPTQPESEVVLAGILQDVYGAGITLTVRGRYDRNWGMLAMAWVWIILVVFLNLVIIRTLFTYISSQSAMAYGDHSKVLQIIRSLRGLMQNNITPDKNSPLIPLCRDQPSDLFFYAIQFIWSARMVGQLSDARALLLNMYLCPTTNALRRTMGEDQDGRIVISALKTSDFFVFGIVLVLPKILLAMMLWYTGSQLLSLTRNVGHLLMKAVVLFYVSLIETEIFQNFLAHSKKEWICDVQMVQVRRAHCRWTISWPGEVLKLFCTLFLVMLARYLFAVVLEVRTLCWNCVHDCPNNCSRAFAYCAKQGWPAR